MASLFVPNPLISEEIKRTAGMEVAMDAIAKAAAERTKSLALPHYLSGAYNDQMAGGAGMGAEGAEGRLVGSAVESGFLEFGTIHNPAFAFMRRACESLGLIFVKGR